jgi:hypothetical protein
LDVRRSINKQQMEKRLSKKRWFMANKLTVRVNFDRSKELSLSDNAANLILD